MLRKLLDKFHPLFDKGGKLEKLFPLYEANDTFLYTPGEITGSNTHVRDSLDLKRMMSMVIVALIPCVFFACYNTGYQANHIVEQAQAVNPDYVPDGWRFAVLDQLGIAYNKTGSYLSIGSLIPCLLHGILYFLPLYIVTMAAGGIAEVVFTIIRGHEVNEGFLVTGMLFPLTLPPTLPLWQCALGIIFGVVIGKEVFGGTGRNFMNPALTGRAFLYFAYAPRMSGATAWTGIDGYSGATTLGRLAENGRPENITEAIKTIPGAVDGISVGPVNANFTWFDAFLGNMQGSLGETSTLACLIGAFILIAAGIGSWRIMSGVVIGAVALATLFQVVGSDTNPMFNLGPGWHLILGGFAFGTVFMATDPVSAAMTNKGKWIYGILIGLMTVLIRVVNIGFPEGIMLAILFGNVFAPLIDYFVVQANIKRRVARNAA